MRFYLDSADATETAGLLGSGLVAGLTTNPTLLQRAGVRNDGIPELVRTARHAGAATVFVQSWGSDAAELEDRGRWLRSLGEDVVVKVPVTDAGLVATARLAADGIPVLVTAVYGAAQVLPVLASGARFVAPYLGRMNDAGLDGVAEIARMQRVVDATGSDLRILVASLRQVSDLLDLAEAGVTDFTFAPAMWPRLAADPLTTAAVAGFEAASAAGG